MRLDISPRMAAWNVPETKREVFDCIARSKTPGRDGTYPLKVNKIRCMGMGVQDSNYVRRGSLKVEVSTICSRHQLNTVWYLQGISVVD